MKFAQAVLLFGGIACSVGACGGGGTVDIPAAPVPGVLTTITATIVDSPLEIGQGTSVTLDGRDGLGAVVRMGTRTVTWTSSNISIATVNNGGNIAGVGVGTVTITASVIEGGKTVSGSASLTVTGIANAPLSADVSMAPQQFIPFQTVVKVGGSVRYFFTAIDHNVIWSPRLPGSPSDILVTTNVVVSRTFPTVGVYNFECTVHPGMVGIVVVSP
jgi:plastocyanin